MAHVRKQIRDAVKTALTGLTTTAGRVYAGRDLPLEAADNLPGLCIYTRSDSPDYEGGTLGRRPLRVIDLVVDGYIKPSTDDALDTIAAEVETAIYVDDTLGGLATGIELGEQTIEVDDEADDNVGRINIGFRIFYRVVEGAPETPA